MFSKAYDKLTRTQVLRLKNKNTSKKFSLINCLTGIKIVTVVVNFLSQVIFIFPLFLGMVIYANEFETKEKQKLPEIKN